MNYKEIASMSNEDLGQKYRVETEMLSRLKFAHAISPIENPMKIRSSRRLVAQLSTEMTKRTKI
ncbi:MAG: 50S ribosomal protein L29 [Bacteroidetes bacterium]|nr:MAG: 50S ribosomal protein L29 [Bacteroidota bacterium]